MLAQLKNGKKNREKQSKSECKKEREKSFPAALILEGKKIPQ